MVNHTFRIPLLWFKTQLTKSKPKAGPEPWTQHGQRQAQPCQKRPTDASQNSQVALNYNPQRCHSFQGGTSKQRALCGLDQGRYNTQSRTFRLVECCFTSTETVGLLGTVEIRTRKKFLAAGEACMATF